MDTFLRFLFEFMSVFFDGLFIILKGIGNGIIQMFNYNQYMFTVKNYATDFEGPEWVLVVAAVALMAIVLGALAFIIYFIIRRILRIRKSIVDQEELLNEIGSLNEKVATMEAEKADLLAMKVSQLGLKPTESPNVDTITNTTSDTLEEESTTEEASSDNEALKEIQDRRFAKLCLVDYQYRNYKIENYNGTYSLEELVEHFRQYSGYHLRLFYSTEMIRLFISALASTKLVILQGISGTGKTSLAYAWGKFIMHDAIIASVQPSWRDRTELFGYFNEFTKKFNETEVLKALYEAGYTDDVYVTVLDEMNIARVEYYFAEMLSILEMPSRDEWVVELVTSVWADDPIKLKAGKLQIPGNMWYIGTINNDDSTFAVTDKVYDRAMPIDINEKFPAFEPVDMPPMRLNDSYLESLFKQATIDHPISKEMIDKINDMDNYVIKHFRIAFGNRIVKQMHIFVANYVACGGAEVDGVDYFIAKKILRKFEQLNLAYIRDEIDGYVKYLDQQFGKEHFGVCKEYLLRLKKMI